jgi:hypothetical protein
MTLPSVALTRNAAAVRSLATGLKDDGDAISCQFRCKRLILCAVARCRLLHLGHAKRRLAAAGLMIAILERRFACQVADGIDIAVTRESC